MNKLFFRLSLLFWVIGVGFVSCSKDELVKEEPSDSVQLRKSETPINNVGELPFDVDTDCSNIDCLLNSVKEYAVSEDYDAMTFYVGYAFQSLLAKDRTLQGQLVKSISESNHISFSELLNNNPKVAIKLNEEIRGVFKNHDAYPNWKKRIGNDLLGSNDNIVNYFNKLISREKKDDELFFYVPDEIKLKFDLINLTIGLDISTIHQDFALAYSNHTPIWLSEKNVKNIKSLIFIGIASDNSFSKRYNTYREIRYKKWHHHGKTVLDTCCPVDVQWIRKWRWYSSWNLHHTDTLSSVGDETIFCYAGYKILAHIDFFSWEGAMGHFSVWETNFCNQTSWKKIF